MASSSSSLSYSTLAVYSYRVLHILQSPISLHDFQEAEPDVLVHSTSTIVKRYSEKGTGLNDDLIAFCKKKALYVEVTII